MNIVVFDFDDTLFPSRHVSWNDLTHKFMVHDGGGHVWRPYLSKLDDEVFGMLQETVVSNLVYILTNATEGWILPTMRTFLPKSLAFCRQEHIRIITIPDLIRQRNLTTSTCPIAWKRIGFRYICDDYTGAINLLCSIGDSIAERTACHEYFLLKKNEISRCRLFELGTASSIPAHLGMIRELRKCLRFYLDIDQRILVNISLDPPRFSFFSKDIKAQDKKIIIMAMYWLFLILASSAIVCFLLYSFLVLNKQQTITSSSSSLPQNEGGKKGVEWLGPGPTVMMRPPAPCQAANPVETPCLSQDPLATFPNAIINFNMSYDTVQTVEVEVVDSKSHVYASGSVRVAPGQQVCSVPLQIADPIPIGTSELKVDYVAVLNKTAVFRTPVHIILPPPSPISPSLPIDITGSSRSPSTVFGGGGGQGKEKLYHWTVLEHERQPWLSTIFLDQFGRCIQNLDEGGQIVVPCDGTLDDLTVYLPASWDPYPLHVTVFVNNKPSHLHLSCYHVSTKSSNQDRIQLKSGDRFGLQLENDAGNFGFATLALRFQY